LILEKLVCFDVVCCMNQNESGMLAVSTGRKPLAVDASYLVFLGMSRIVDNLVNARLLANFSRSKFFAYVSGHVFSFCGGRNHA
jgi:hypothetical protein